MIRTKIRGIESAEEYGCVSDNGTNREEREKLMRGHELKRLRREDLLEIMIEQQKQNETLQQELEEVKSELEEKKQIIAESGSIAEAALRVFHVFDDAQKAADLYLSHVQEHKEQMEARLQELEKNCHIRAQRMLDDATRQANLIIYNARREADRMIEQAKQKVEMSPD